MKRISFSLLLALLLGASIITLKNQSTSVVAQSSPPEMTVPNLAVRTTVANLITPISMAFVGANDFSYSRRTLEK